MLVVDLEGFEPSSKRGINLLSTCLSLLKFSISYKRKATEYETYSLNFIRRPGRPSNYLRYSCTTVSDCFEATASG